MEKCWHDPKYTVLVAPQFLNCGLPQYGDLNIGPQNPIESLYNPSISPISPFKGTPNSGNTQIGFRYILGGPPIPCNSGIIRI